MSTTAFDPSALARDLLHCFRNQKDLADRALAQLSDAAFLAPGAGAVDPIAITVKHVGGNLRSRWRDFLTTDGEKPDRHRDTEFELAAGESRADVTALWEAGWAEVLGTLEGLAPADWTATVTIRGEPHSVAQAALRSLAHTSYHVGQIVQSAKAAAGDAWHTLSIPRHGSEAFRIRPAQYLDGPKDDPGSHA